MPSGPDPITDPEIREIAEKVPPPVATFLLTSETSADSIIRPHQRTRTNTIQIVDIPESGTYQVLRSEIPGVKLVQVIHVIDQNSIDQALEAAQHVDALLLDSGNPKLTIKELGGTGRVHDWALSRKIRNATDIPLFLAGGLNHENVADAIRSVEPYGIDVCSGVRTDGKLDSNKLSLFFMAIRNMV